MRKFFLAVVLLTAGTTAAAFAADFNGDGTGDIAVFRGSTGLWSVRGATRIYFGGSGDVPVPGDYDGGGSDRPAVFRAASGLWRARGLTRLYFGGASDAARPGDYNGDGTWDAGVFRGGSGLWAAKGVTRAYFGGSADTALSPGGRSWAVCDLLRTGQTVSYQAGDDGDYQKGADFNYQTLDPVGNGDVVTVDGVTGLIWASDGLGKGGNWGEQTSWSEAVAWAEGLVFAGFSDWRLPNIRELDSILDFGRTEFALNPVYFSNIQTGVYWSGTSDEYISTKSWVVYFYQGTSGTEFKDAWTGQVLAVRAGR